jgi:hypothetical protein
LAENGWPKSLAMATGLVVYNPLIEVGIPVVPHKAVAEVSKIGNLYERLVVVNHGWQSQATDGPKGA